MNFKKTMFALAIGSVGIMGAMSAHAVANTFSFNGGTIVGGLPTGGSWFSMLATDTNSDGIPDQNVYTGMRAAGAIGADLSPGTLNFDVAETITIGPGGAVRNSGNSIDRDWSFFSAWGAHFTNQALEVVWDGTSNTASVNMAGWTVAWNGGSIDMGTGANAIINLGGDGLGGGNDTLDYSAVVSTGAFAGVNYGLHLAGSAALTAPIPEASTYGMMLAGLGLVGFAVRRRKQTI